MSMPNKMLDAELRLGCSEVSILAMLIIVRENVKNIERGGVYIFWGRVGLGVEHFCQAQFQLQFQSNLIELR